MPDACYSLMEAGAKRAANEAELRWKCVCYLAHCCELPTIAAKRAVVNRLPTSRAGRSRHCQMCLCTCGATACYVETLICVKHGSASSMVFACRQSLPPCFAVQHAREKHPPDDRACARSMPSAIAEVRANLAKFAEIWRGSRKSQSCRKKT